VYGRGRKEMRTQGEGNGDGDGERWDGNGKVMLGKIAPPTRLITTIVSAGHYWEGGL
jgi:hypothetical protein